MAKADTKKKTVKSKSKKRKGLHLKRSARWTIAGLLMATAIIIALIPVQNGGVSATSGNDDGPFKVTPSLEEIVKDSSAGGYAKFTDSEMSVVVDSGSKEYKGFPIKHEGDMETGDLVFVDTQSDNALAIQVDVNSGFYNYRMDDKDNNTITSWTPSSSDKFFLLADKLPSSETDKSIFKMGSKDAGDFANVITQYVGGKNGYITDGVVSLNDGTVGYSMPEWDYEYRILYVSKHAPKLDADGNPTGEPDPTKYEYENKRFLVCTNKATVQYIADGAFKKADSDDPANIATLTLPQNLLRIGNNAFQGQANIRAIEGGQALSNIGKEAFEGCSSLTTVSFNDISPLQNIGDGAFANCTALNSIVLPNNTQAIGSGAFYSCKSLNDCDGDAISEDSSKMFTLTKGSDVNMSIGNYTFAGCERLTNIALDKDVTSIGVGVFADCPNLETVVMAGSDNTVNYSPDTFANDHNLKYVRIPNEDTAHLFKNSDGQELVTKPCIFVTSTNQKQNTPGYDPSSDTPQPLEPITMDRELFAVWGPEPSISSNIHKYAQTYGITYMYEKDGIIYYELTLNGYTFSFNQDGIITGCVPAEGVPQDINLEIPEKIGGVPIVGIADGAFKNMQATSGNPKNIIIPDTIKSIGKEAFYNCANIEYVDITTQGVNIGNSAFAGNSKLKTVSFTQNDPIGETTIGNSCFEGDSALELVSFRNTGLDQDNINVVNVTSIGDRAFYTGNNAGLTMQGDMRPGYAPYDFAINPDNRTSSGAYSYITYQTGNPDNLVCKYDKGLEKVSLISYPCADTIVGKDESGNNVTIHSIEEKLAKYKITQADEDMPSVMELYILDRYKNIIVPKGIETVENAVAKDGGTHGNPAFKNLYEDATSQYNDGTGDKPCNNMHSMETLQILGVNSIPSYCCKEDSNLRTVVIDGEIEDVGEHAFENCSNLSSVRIIGNVSDPDMPCDTFYGCSSLQHVSFEGEGNKEDATPLDPYYWCEGGVIYKYDGTETTLVEGLPGIESVTAREDVDKINENAFDNCDRLVSADFSSCKNLYTIPKRCFYDCNSLISVILPEKCDSIYDEAFGFPKGAGPDGADDTPTNNLDVTMLAHEIYIRDDAFNHRVNPVNPDSPHTTIHSYDDTAAKRYTSRFDNKVKFISDQYDDVTIRFVYYVDNEVVIEEIKVPYNTTPSPIPDVPVDGRKGFEYTGNWDSYITPAVGFKQYTAVYKEKTDTSSSSTSSSSTPSSSSSRPSTSSSSSSSTNKSSSSSTSGNGNGNGNNSSSVKPVIISGAPAPVAMPAVNSQAPAAAGTTGAASSGSGNGNGVATGNTNVVSSAPGISHNNAMSATVNGSSDNYIIKLTETAEADEAAKQALTGAFGSLDNIRYMPFDISLYDSTGTQKITPVPAGVTVSVTMPIPDDLAIYGGNNKVASTVGGTLDVIQPRFTVIDGVPCMNFTVSHLSPYVIYVDTANLTASGNLDATPKTGDPIHPKWFLVIGLAAISIFLFLKRDKEQVRVAN